MLVGNERFKSKAIQLIASGRPVTEPIVEVGSHDAPTISHDALAGQGDPMTEKTTAIDPVCGMTVDTATAEYRSCQNGKVYYFCAAGCKASFDRAPEKFIGASTKGQGH